MSTIQQSSNANESDTIQSNVNQFDEGQSNADQAEGHTQGKSEEIVECTRERSMEAKTEEIVECRKERGNKGKTEEIVESSKERANEAKGKGKESTPPTMSEPTRQSVQQELERTYFLQQTGEKVVNMAQGAVDSVRNKLGIGIGGERNK